MCCSAMFGQQIPQNLGSEKLKKTHPELDYKMQKNRYSKVILTTTKAWQMRSPDVVHVVRPFIFVTSNCYVVSHKVYF